MPLSCKHHLGTTHPFLCSLHHLLQPAAQGTSEQQETHSWVLLPSMAWAPWTSQYPQVPQALYQSPISKRCSVGTLQGKHTALSMMPQKTLAQTPLASLPFLQGSRAMSPSDQRKSYQPGVPFPAQTCSEGSSTWQAAAFAVSVHPKIHSRCITPALTPLGHFPSL